MRREVQWKNGIKEMILISLPFFYPNWPVVIFGNRIKQEFFSCANDLPSISPDAHLFPYYDLICPRGLLMENGSANCELQNRFRDGHNY